MPDLPAGAEGIGGVILGAITTLGLAATFIKRKTDGLKEEREQQTAEHKARLAVLEAERVAAEKGGTADLSAMVAAEVQRLLPDAVAKVQAEERARVALEREEERKIQDQLRRLVQEQLRLAQEGQE